MTNDPFDPQEAPPRSHRFAYFGDGLAINLLSPVIISYYLSVVPSFIPAGASRLYYSGLAATHVGLAVVCSGLTSVATQSRVFAANISTLLGMETLPVAALAVGFLLIVVVGFGV